MSAEDVRKLVKGCNLDDPEKIYHYLSLRVKELQDQGLASEVVDQQALIPVLAADMKRKSPGEVKSDEAWAAAAKQQIDDNRTTALTTSDDRYTGIKGGAKYDEIHELVHICSAKGGESDFHAWKLQVNEGAINFFAEKIAPKLGVTVVDRYVTGTRLVKKLVELAGANGPQKLYGATFSGQIKEFFDAVGVGCFNLKEKNLNGSAKNRSEKDMKAGELAINYHDKAKNWSLKWLEDRLSKKGDFPEVA
jgi:hypothetical protein